MGPHGTQTSGDWILRRRASGVIVVPPGGVPGVPGVNPSGGVPGVPGFVPGVNPSGGLPPGANITAATNVTKLLFVNTPNTVSAAKVQLGQFQASVGLAPTGTLDPQTRAMMVLAYPSAASLPTPTHDCRTVNRRTVHAQQLGDVIEGESILSPLNQVLFEAPPVLDFFEFVEA